MIGLNMSWCVWGFSFAIKNKMIFEVCPSSQNGNVTPIRRIRDYDKETESSLRGVQIGSTSCSSLSPSFPWIRVPIWWQRLASSRRDRGLYRDHRRLLYWLDPVGWLGWGAGIGSHWWHHSDHFSPLIPTFYKPSLHPRLSSRNNTNSNSWRGE